MIIKTKLEMGILPSELSHKLREVLTERLYDQFSSSESKSNKTNKHAIVSHSSLPY